LAASNESAIHAGIGAAASGAVALGASVALNQIGHEADGSSAPIGVHAGVQNTGVNAGADLTATAHSAQTIDALTAALSVPVTSGGDEGLSLAGSGVDAQNQIATDVQASVDGGPGVTAASVALAADDTSEIGSIAGAASIAVTDSGDAITLSIAVSLAQNEI